MAKKRSKTTTIMHQEPDLQGPGPEVQDEGRQLRRRVVRRQQGRPGGRVNPTNGELLARIEQASAKDYDQVMKQAQKAFLVWRELPAPQRGEIVRQVGEALREKKEMLGALVSLEMGKILHRGPGRGAGDDRHLRLRRGPEPLPQRARPCRASAPSTA